MYGRDTIAGCSVGQQLDRHMTNLDRDTQDGLDAADIRAALERMVASRELSSSPQLASFLRFVVEAKLAGESHHIKAYTIAVAALGRADSFDPQADPIVRVEAGRLRRALDRYYAGTGADEAIIIDLVRGSYVPVFRRRSDNGANLPVPGFLSRVMSMRLPSWLRIAAIAALCPIGLGLGALIFHWHAADHRTTPAVNPGFTEGRSTSRLRPGSGMPVVFIQPFDAIGAPAGRSIAIDALRRRLRDALARFDEIEVVADPAPAAEPHDDAPTEPRPHGDYRLAATLEYNKDGSAGVSFRLIDQRDGTVAWARTFMNLAAAADRLAAEEDIARQVATTIAPPYGVIYARELARRDGKDRDPRYLCLLDALEYLRNYDPDWHPRVRACLERVIALDPGSAGSHAALANQLLREYLFRGEGQSAVDLAISAAKRAVELAPESARAHQALMNALFARGERAAALAEGEKAAALNPYDMLALASYGMRLVSSGEIDKGMAVVKQAASLGTARPMFLDFALYLEAYLRGDDTSAAYHASLLTGDAYPLGLLARALVAAKAGERDRARQIIARLTTLHPQWRSDPRAAIARYIGAPLIVERLTGDLAAASRPGPG
jgi:tetratricopeptide (TPR) repeat protein